MPPPVFLNFGMPTPAKRPPSWGAAGSPPAASPPVSLLLLALLPDPGIGGARPDGGPPSLGTVGAANPEGADDDDDLSSSGPDLSFVSAFLSFRPLVMSPRRAPFCESMISFLGMMPSQAAIPCLTHPVFCD